MHCPITVNDKAEYSRLYLSNLLYQEKYCCNAKKHLIVYL